MIIDVARIEHRQYVRVLQLCRNLDLVQELLVPGIGVLFRNLQRDSLLLDRVVGTIDIRKRAGRNPAENAVFPDFLSSSQQSWMRYRRRPAAMQGRTAIIGALQGPVKASVTVIRA